MQGSEVLFCAVRCAYAPSLCGGDFLLLYDNANCVRGNSFTAAGEAELFLGGCLDADAVGRYSQGECELFSHKLNVWGEFWGLRDNCGINI